MLSTTLSLSILVVLQVSVPAWAFPLVQDDVSGSQRGTVKLDLAFQNRIHHGRSASEAPVDTKNLPGAAGPLVNLSGELLGHLGGITGPYSPPLHVRSLHRRRRRASHAAGSRSPPKQASPEAAKPKAKSSSKSASAAPPPSGRKGTSNSGTGHPASHKASVGVQAAGHVEHKTSPGRPGAQLAGFGNHGAPLYKQVKQKLRRGGVLGLGGISAIAVADISLLSAEVGEQRNSATENQSSSVGDEAARSRGPFTSTSDPLGPALSYVTSNNNENKPVPQQGSHVGYTRPGSGPRSNSAPHKWDEGYRVDSAAERARSRRAAGGGGPDPAISSSANESSPMGNHDESEERFSANRRATNVGRPSTNDLQPLA